MDDFVEQFKQNYQLGYFILGDEANPHAIYWAKSKERFIIPLEEFRITRRLRRKIRSNPFQITINRNCPLVIDHCSRRENTWINPAVRDIYIRLNKLKLVHSLETWEGDTLVGGLYGVSMGSVFFGESMFFTKSDASKIALVYLVDHLNRTGFDVLDAQMPSAHLVKMGGRLISEEKFRKLLRKACQKPDAQFSSIPVETSGARVVQRISQKSNRGCSTADKAGD